MDLSDILAIVDATAGGDHVIRFVEQLADQHPVHVSGLVIGWRPAFRLSEATAVDAPIRQWMEAAEETLELDVRTVRSRFEQLPTPGEVEGLFVDARTARQAVGIRALHRDVSVVARPRDLAVETANCLVEAVLIRSGRPVFVVPPGWTRREIGRVVLVCWKPTREAARAVADAGPIIRSAERVVVVTVDAHPDKSDHGEASGAAICAHLARAGAKVDLDNLSSGGRTDAETILAHALSVGADLIVMGGYGHSRMREFVLGGLTREMLTNASTPLLMSH